MLWNSKSYEVISKITVLIFIYYSKEHTDDVNCVKFSPNGLSFVSCSNDITIKIWNSYDE